MFVLVDFLGVLTMTEKTIYSCKTFPLTLAMITDNFVSVAYHIMRAKVVAATISGEAIIVGDAGAAAVRVADAFVLKTTARLAFILGITYAFERFQTH